MRVTLLIACISALAAAQPPATGPSTKPGGPGDPRWQLVANAIAPGQFHDGVYTVTLPRKDLDLINELGEVPAAAGIETVLHFIGCPCEKLKVVGQFCVTDYEANDVIDELRAGKLSIVSMGPMLLGERPRILVLRFQGEASVEDLAATFKKALRWMGEERFKRAKPVAE